MERNMILSGVGGQGILTISYLICHAALDKGLNFKQAEVHGMAQRGGAVQSHLRISDKPIASDLIAQGTSDLILSVEPLEVFRYLDFLKPDGIVITSTVPFKNISDYPIESDLLELLDKLPRKVLIDTKTIATKIGNPKIQNMIILGAALPTLGFAVDDFDHHLVQLFGAKGEKVIDMNRQAIRSGYDLAKQTL